MIIYMKVSKDKYELPVALADTVKELAEICGVTANLISSCISHAKADGYESVYKRIVIKDE